MKTLLIATLLFSPIVKAEWTEADADAFLAKMEAQELKEKAVKEAYEKAEEKELIKFNEQKVKCIEAVGKLKLSENMQLEYAKACLIKHGWKLEESK